jgi:hypothetical protein
VQSAAIAPPRSRPYLSRPLPGRVQLSEPEQGRPSHQVNDTVSEGRRLAEHPQVQLVHSGRFSYPILLVRQVYSRSVAPSCSTAFLAGSAWSKWAFGLGPKSVCVIWVALTR